MAQNTDLNVSPYYDDYDETKDFHRILFRPTNAIQARELTQLQSILQNQVEKFGNHIFDEGSIVMGGTVTVHTNYAAVKVNATNPNGAGTATAETYREAAVGNWYRGATSGCVGKVINTTAQTTDDYLTLFVYYVKVGNPTGTAVRGDTNYYPTFADNEELEQMSTAADGAYVTGGSNNEFKTITTSATSIGSAAILREGIFYVRGFFIRTEKQTILLDKYTNTPTYRIGLQVDETVISSADDTSLLDNATGATNENAPGANRLKIALTLSKQSTSSAQSVDNFIELSRVEEGYITKQTEVTAYNTLERTLARRTFDESGDYVLRPFKLEAREHLNNTVNGGIYLAANTTTPGDASKFVAVLSSGKGYVKGFEIDKPSESFLEISKARDTNDITNLAVPFEIGNYYNLTSALGQPEFGVGSSAVTPFGTIDLYSDAKANLADATASGTLIGKARCRYFNYISGNPASGVHIAADKFRIYLFDIRMFTKLTVANTTYALTAGQRVVGSASNAKGTVAVSSANTATTVYLMDVEGVFSTSDTLRAEWTTSGGKAISAIRTYSTDRVRSLFQASRTSNSANFTADVITTDSQFPLTGSIALTSGSTAMTGVNSTFTRELKEGDIVVSAKGTARIIASVTNDTAAVLTANAGETIYGTVIRQRAQLQEQEKTVAIAATPKDFVSSITPSVQVIRKQGAMTLSSGAGTITAGNAEVLVAEDANDYIVTIMESSEGSDADEGDVVDIAEAGGTLAVAGGSGGAITITASASTPVTDTDQLKVIYAVTKSDVTHGSKTIRKARGVKITTTASDLPDSSASADVYGTNVNDQVITLGVPDVYQIKGIYESNDTTDALPPKLTLGASGFVGSPGDQISGGTSGAIGRIIQFTGTTIWFYYETTTLFAAAETVTNDDNTDTSTNNKSISSVTVDSKDIMSSFFFDDGQRDAYYGLASIRRKSGSPTPSNPMLVIFDYFTAAGGNFFTVNSYSGIDYEKLPTYIPNIIDPTGLEPDGEYELSDAIDYRSYVHSLHDVSSALSASSTALTVTDVSSITAQPLAYATEEFTSARAVAFDLPKSGESLSTTTMTHYLPRIDKISLSADGNFILSSGLPAETPSAPSSPSNSILLHTIYLPPYVKSLSSLRVRTMDHRRFTMRDIGRIQGRVKNIERVTSLNALEQETNLQQIQGSGGLDRFKSGFVTDNFRGHKTGDVHHPDYKIAVDRSFGILRPETSSRFADLSLNTDKSTGYWLGPVNTVETNQPTYNGDSGGDLITLTYDEVPYVNQPQASTAEFINPYDVVLFRGAVDLSPAKDLWFDTERRPSVTRIVEGDYDAVVAGATIGTVWNAWQSDHFGEPVATVDDPSFTWPGVPISAMGGGVYGEFVITPEMRRQWRYFMSGQGFYSGGGGRYSGPIIDASINVPNKARQTRTGIKTSVVEEWAETRGDRIVSTNIAQTMRPRRITVTGTGFKPSTNFFIFFDGIDVNAHCTPTAVAYGLNDAVTKGTPLVSSPIGKISAYFDIPSTDALNFACGNKTLRVTQSSTNLPQEQSSELLSIGEANYSSNGELRTVQEEIISTRNGRVVVENVPETRESPTQSVKYNDPLAQSFLVDTKNGIFVTSIDLYFAARPNLVSNSMPITIQLRHMENGLPTQKILPFGESTLYPNQINMYNEGRTGPPGGHETELGATKFKFTSPVYLESGREYCIVIVTDSDDAKVWVAEMAGRDWYSGNFIDQQPYAGSLFKSQNNSTWTADQMRDLKFTIWRAKFDWMNQALVQFDNDDLEADNLQINPIDTITGTKTFRVMHHSHGNYDQTKSNITIAGVIGDRIGSVVSFTDDTISATGTVTSDAQTLSGTGGTGTGIIATITTNTSASTGIVITNPGQGYVAGDDIVFTKDSETLTFDVATVKETLGGIPIEYINTTHSAGTSASAATSGARILADIDEYLITIPDATWPVRDAAANTGVNYQGATENTMGGGSDVTATSNIYYDTLHTALPIIELPNTTITSTFLGTSATQASYLASPAVSYTKATTSTDIVVNDNNYLRISQLVASPINETNEMGGTKSLNLTLNLVSTVNNVSPVVDIDSIGMVGIQNRINKVDSATDVQANSWVQPTEARGDNNAAIYMTKRVQLKNPANSIHVLFDGYKAPHGVTDPTIDVYYKVLGPDSNLQFNDMGWVLATIKTTVQPDFTDFKEHEYEIEGLEDFTSFSVKLVLQSVDSANCPLITNFRAIALST